MMCTLTLECFRKKITPLYRLVLCMCWLSGQNWMGWHNIIFCDSKEVEAVHCLTKGLVRHDA